MLIRFFHLPLWILPLLVSGFLTLTGHGALGQVPKVSSKEHALWRLSVDRALLEASLGPVKKQLIALDELEKQRATARDYEGALAVRTERRKLEGLLVQLDRELARLGMREQALRTAAVPGRLSMPLEQAVLDGVVHQGGVLSGWSREGATATWQLPSLPPGGYEVIIRYRCGPLEGGILEVREAHYHLEAPIETTLKGPQEKNLGTLKITDGNGKLTLQGRALLKGSLMDLLGLWLVPAAR